MTESRRSFLRRAALTASALVSLKSLSACASARSGQGLISDPEGRIDLPPGFDYRALSRTGEVMSDGLFVPGAHDGMAAFPIEGDSARCVLVRNHEINSDDDSQGAFGPGEATRVDQEFIYDRTAAGRPLHGGTTTLIVNLRERRVERSFLSLAGTARNCAGGPTPWGSWLTCEETDEKQGASAQRMHGYVFEVPAHASGLVQPVPLTTMGRFVHEATATDPMTGAVYQTEDDGEGLFYRFLPNTTGALARGGRLQALALADQAGADTRNWGPHSIPVGARLAVRWIDLDNVEAPDGDLRLRGHAAGAALFARGEGMATGIEQGRPAIYFACTSGGAARRGQVWKLTPGADGADTLELFAESTGEAHFDMVDNIVVAPWGDLVICEDGGGDNYVRGVSPTGLVYPIARTRGSEFCGVCFSPDGSVLFVNAQDHGFTCAISGPWAELARAARSPE